MAVSQALATAFFRLYILHLLERGPARPAALLASFDRREGMPRLPSGGFTRALQQLIDAGCVVAAPAGAVHLTEFGIRERAVQREAWEAILTAVARLLGDETPQPPEAPGDDGIPLAPPEPERMADAHRERVVAAEVRSAIRRGRETGAPFSAVIARIAIVHPRPMQSRAMLQRALRECLGTATATFGAEVKATRYGTDGVLLVCPGDGATQAELLQSRLVESLGAMTATVRAFAGARHAVRIGVARWTASIATSAHLLRLAEDELGSRAQQASAA
jgi:hypothetical protein